MASNTLTHFTAMLLIVLVTAQTATSATPLKTTKKPNHYNITEGDFVTLMTDTPLTPDQIAMTNKYFNKRNATKKYVSGRLDCIHYSKEEIAAGVICEGPTKQKLFTSPRKEIANFCTILTHNPLYIVAKEEKPLSVTMYLIIIFVPLAFALLACFMVVLYRDWRKGRKLFDINV